MHTHSGCCGCSSHTMGRRTFLGAMGGTALGAAALTSVAQNIAATAAIDNGERPRPSLTKKPLIVQPALAYAIFSRREQTSWRPWGGFHTEEDINKEIAHIEEELKALAQKAEFPIEIRPVARVTTVEQAAQLCAGDARLMLIYGANAGGDVVEALISTARHNLVYVRHRTGPAYLWYEITHPRLLRKAVDEYGQPGLETYDVVVDEYDDLLWRMRGCYALENSVGSRIIAVGGPAGWGTGGQEAPDIARDKWKLDIIPVSYEDLGKRLESAQADAVLLERAANEAKAYLADQSIQLNTAPEFVTRAFVLRDVFEAFMAEAGAQAMTINDCMTTIMPVSQTTACLSLTLVNDSGAMAFCESDFVVIPSGILLNHIASTPVFLQDPTYPHHGLVTLAHCTAPRRMDGKNLEPAAIMTHFESDYGAAPKVEMRKGQVVTVLDPDFKCERWLGFRGHITDNPNMDICRSQIDVAIDGDCQKLVDEMVGFHWMLAYGDHLKETGYALRKLGVKWQNITTGATVEA